jgi:hypothetical protein
MKWPRLLAALLLAASSAFAGPPLLVDVQPTPKECGWGECGLRVQRDTRAIQGGTFGNTESVFTVWERAGPEIASRVFSTLLLTESFQNQGEAVALYAKTIRQGSVHAWGATIELNDPAGRPGPSVGLEVDVFTTGPAADSVDLSSNGGRVRTGVDIVGGDEKYKLGHGSSGAEGTFGLRVYATSTTPHFRWYVGASLEDWKRTGVQVIGRGGERFIDLQGEAVVGIDVSRANVQSVIRLRAGQAYSFDEYDDMLVRRDGEDFEILRRAWVGDGWQHVPVFTVTGDGEVRARKFTLIP